MTALRLGAGFLLMLLMVACRDSGEAPSATPALATDAPPVSTNTPQGTSTPQPSEGLEPTPTPAPVGGSPTATGDQAGGNADVTFVRAVQAGDGSWTFHVTVEHPDTGWEDYADGWDVVTPSGQVIKRDAEDAFTRVLLHPHVDEQPFTRSQSSLTFPDSVEQVTVRAHDLVDGFGGQEIVVDLTTASGPGFEVQRREE